jgi:Na+-transporting methylmalonyl-CoA/oxaloacetate decarboxylase beta subunit
MRISRERKNTSPAKRALGFVVHQLVATLLIPIATPFLLAVCSDAVRILGHAVTSRDLHRILTETPYFPVQVTLAILLGWSLSMWLRHSAMQWVWVLPLIVLCVGSFVVPGVSGLSVGARLAHFFGRGCRPEDRCFDQLVLTMPFYTSAAYSIGAFLALKMSRRHAPDTSAEPDFLGAAGGAR